MPVASFIEAPGLARRAWASCNAAASFCTVSRISLHLLRSDMPGSVGLSSLDCPFRNVHGQISAGNGCNEPEHSILVPRFSTTSSSGRRRSMRAAGQKHPSPVSAHLGLTRTHWPIDWIRSGFPSGRALRGDGLYAAVDRWRCDEIAPSQRAR
jgi:hypothetical protein